MIETTLGSIIGINLKSSEVIYWSYSPSENSSWSELNNAREEFGEEIKRSSEPDIIIKTNNSLFFIEAKLTAGNETLPSDKNNLKNYLNGGNNWFKKVFKSNYKTVAIDEKKYELLRFWLLGTWIAKQLNLDFYLVNLVLQEREKKIEKNFKKHIIENNNRKFVRITWEDLYHCIKESNFESTEKDKMIRYFMNKTIGYNNDRKLQKAFSVLRGNRHE